MWPHTVAAVVPHLGTLLLLLLLLRLSHPFRPPTGSGQLTCQLGTFPGTTTHSGEAIFKIHSEISLLWNAGSIRQWVGMGGPGVPDACQSTQRVESRESSLSPWFPANAYRLGYCLGMVLCLLNSFPPCQQSYRLENGKCLQNINLLRKPS